MMYLIKTEGVADYPDYIQIRNEQFELVRYCKTEHIEKYLNPDITEKEKQQFFQLIQKMTPGKIQKFHL